MSESIGRRRWLRAALVLGSTAWLRTASACQFFTSHFTIVHPWTRATGEGDTSAIVCMVFEDVTDSDRLVGVHTPVAESAEMGGYAFLPGVDFAIHAGQTSALTESGVHVRLIGLTQPLEVARTYPLTLVFAKAGTVQTTLTVDYARFS